MKPFFLFCLTAVVLTSCLQSLDKDLVSNPLDKNYPGDYVIVDEITFKDKDYAGKPACIPVIKFHLDPLTASRLERMEGLAANLLVFVERNYTGYGSKTTFYKQYIPTLQKDTTYTATKPSWFGPVKGDSMCIKACIIQISPFSTQLNPLADTSKIQVVSCFACGG